MSRSVSEWVRSWAFFEAVGHVFSLFFLSFPVLRFFFLGEFWGNFGSLSQKFKQHIQTAGRFDDWRSSAADVVG